MDPATKLELIDCFTQVQESLPGLARKRLADHIAMQSPDAKEYMEKATQAKEKLGLFVKGADWAQFGGLEGCCTLVRMARIDEDRNGKISADELRAIEALGDQLVSDAIGLATHTGFVSALILTVCVPLELPEASEASADVFSNLVTDILAHLCIFADAITFTCCCFRTF